MRSLVFILVAAQGLLSCANSDGTLGQRGSPMWYGQSTDAQKEAFFKEVCNSRYGLSEGREFQTCVKDVRTTWAIYNDEVLLCPLTKWQISQGLTCTNEVPKYGRDIAKTDWAANLIFNALP